MAKKSSGGRGPVNSPEHMNMRTNVRLGDIYTAAKSDMEPCDYEKGYPPPPDTLHNLGPLGGRKR